MKRIPPGPPPVVVTRGKPNGGDGDCPIPNTHEKIEESHYFLHNAAENYHWPDPFRWNLNAFLQALRSTTFYLQKEKDQVPGFDSWYPEQQEAMRANPLLKCFD